ncbi:hypothetical protein B0H19DRAFT_1383638 [Mycena capillaripes]|nr:hypothetical protein B0H19DRAFT_1383638 [Mycena capillaripes]
MLIPVRNADWLQNYSAGAIDHCNCDLRGYVPVPWFLVFGLFYPLSPTRYFISHFPNTVCVRYGLSIGAACAPFILGSCVSSRPSRGPSHLLDLVLGTHELHTYKKRLRASPCMSRTTLTRSLDFG